jgi:hypothetical protein
MTTKTSDKLFCPRAIENGGGPDSPFTPPLNGEMTWREDHTCSYCGSLSEESFFQAIEEGVKLAPTDKNYKVYVDVKVHGAGKFYFQHLSKEGRTKFVKLLNEKRVNLAAPGHFYVLPFFVSYVE